MNNPEDAPVDIQFEREWLTERKERLGLSWRAIAQESGIPQGTISAWLYASDESYKGNSQNIARKVMKYRQMVESQADHGDAAARAGLNREPKHVDMPTGRRLNALFVEAHSGEITVAGMGPGTGKTKMARNYASCASNCVVVTIKPSTNTLTAMISEVLRALGGKVGTAWVRQMSAQVVDIVTGRRMLIIVDEANHLPFEAFEELRSWNDIAGVGICLLGNEELLATIRTGTSKQSRSAFARLNSRIAMSHVQDLPTQGDIDAYLDAWGMPHGRRANHSRRARLPRRDTPRLPATRRRWRRVPAKLQAPLQPARLGLVRAGVKAAVQPTRDAAFPRLRRR